MSLKGWDPVSTQKILILSYDAAVRLVLSHSSRYIKTRYKAITDPAVLFLGLEVTLVTLCSSNSTSFCSKKPHTIYWRLRCSGLSYVKFTAINSMKCTFMKFLRRIVCLSKIGILNHIILVHPMRETWNLSFWTLNNVHKKARVRRRYIRKLFLWSYSTDNICCHASVNIEKLNSEVFQSLLHSDTLSKISNHQEIFAWNPSNHVQTFALSKTLQACANIWIWLYKTCNLVLTFAVSFVKFILRTSNFRATLSKYSQLNPSRFSGAIWSTWYERLMHFQQ